MSFYMQDESLLEANENSIGDENFITAKKYKCSTPFGENQNVDNILQEKCNKKRKSSDGHERTKTPQAVAVARRNARERNRVKQVNNGFASLRQHIPESIAKCFEQTSNKSSAKKLSKVETLRMAVEYIRQLESMLGDSSSANFMNCTTISSETPPPDLNPVSQTCFYEIKPTFNGTDTEIAIINGQQYVRIPGSNTFQLITTQKIDDLEIKPDSAILSQLCMSYSSSQSTIDDSEILSFTQDLQMKPQILTEFKEEPDNF